MALVRQFSTIKSKNCHFENVAENVHVCFEVHIKKLKTLTMNKNGCFCPIYFRHRRKKFCWVGAYNNTKSIHQKGILEILCKKKILCML